MKKLWPPHILFLVVSLQLTWPVNSPAASLNILLTPPEKFLARGAATPDQLAKTVLLAIQENNTHALNAFLLEDKEIVLLKNKGSEDMQAFLENTTATDLQNNFRRNYQNLIEQGISQTINW